MEEAIDNQGLNIQEDGGCFVKRMNWTIVLYGDGDQHSVSRLSQDILSNQSKHGLIYGAWL